LKQNELVHCVKVYQDMCPGKDFSLSASNIEMGVDANDPIFPEQLRGYFLLPIFGKSYERT
jgi:hypothetical protein